MRPVPRNALAIVAGFVLGSAVNMGIVVAGSSLVPPPPGVDVTDAEAFRANIDRFEPKHFAPPFVAHALGTGVGAFVAFALAGSRRAAMAYGVGGLFLVGGIIAATMIPAPAWFVAVDLVLAYLPMAWLGAWAAGRLTRRSG